MKNFSRWDREVTRPLANPESLIRRVYAYVAYRLGDGPDAEDVTSETFERALRYRASYDRSKGEPIAWLVGIARRCVDDLLARPRVSADEPPDLVAPGDLEEEVLEQIHVSSTLSQLSDRDRELVSLRYGADLTSRQIGDLLGISTPTVDVALSRARARMGALMEPEGHPERQAPATPPRSLKQV